MCLLLACSGLVGGIPILCDPKTRRVESGGDLLFPGPFSMKGRQRGLSCQKEVTNIHSNLTRQSRPFQPEARI
ncbi:hypothetical protein GGR56DRAFT_626256 [Xylariaceae sp. FL0804]|nr:hypothetical protein GGR56DRAFT_626256 [Xylariaceae sp. FL0804]